MGTLGNSLVVLEKAADERAAQKGAWPTEPPFGPGVGYEVLPHTPSVDGLTGLVAVPVKNLATGAITWFVLDLAQPAAPKVVAFKRGLTAAGALSNGTLYAQDITGKVQIAQITIGVPGVDDGPCGLPRVDIAMDGNRNGEDTIDFDDPVNSKYLFWVNDDNDRAEWDLKSLRYAEDDFPAKYSGDPGQGPNRNCDDDIINCKRDLEDFTRLHLRVDDGTAKLANVTYWMKFENVTGSPSVNLFEAIDTTMNYLIKDSKADDQLKKKRVITVDSTLVQLPNQYIQAGGQVSPFILEGKSEGKGDLTLIVKTNGIEVARKAVQLELRSMSTFWEKFVVTTTSGDLVQQTATQVGKYTYTPPSPKTNEYVLYVHGWNMGGFDTDGWEKDRWAETVFKRLWWLGYKGEVGGFQWPTLGSADYDPSELRAWNSGQALNTLIKALDAKHPGQVRVIAHSMGNVVMGEALRLFTAPVVHTYIAAQAAIPASCYDEKVPPFWPDGYTTPDIYGHYPSGRPSDPPFLIGNVAKVLQGRLYNYFNQDDLALRGWRLNNRMKPDGGYSYVDGDGDMNTYLPALGDQFSSLAAILGFPNDRFEIFARCGNSRSQALGSEPYPVKGFAQKDLKTSFGFDGWHYSHSREFRSNTVNERPFWLQAGKHFLLKGFETIQ